MSSCAHHSRCPSSCTSKVLTCNCSLFVSENFLQEYKLKYKKGLLLFNETILNVRRSKLLKKGLERPNYGRYQLGNLKFPNCHMLLEIFVYNLYFHTKPYHFQHSCQQPSNHLIIRSYIGQLIIKRFIFTPTLSDETRELGDIDIIILQIKLALRSTYRFFCGK